MRSATIANIEACIQLAKLLNKPIVQGVNEELRQDGFAEEVPELITIVAENMEKRSNYRMQARA